MCETMGASWAPGGIPLHTLHAAKYSHNIHYMQSNTPTDCVLKPALLRSACRCCVAQGMPLRRASATPTQLLDALRRRHEAVRAEMEVQAHRAARLDKKASVLLTGLQQRHKKLRPQLEETAAQLTAAHVELESFRALQEQERRNAPDRVERMQALLDGQLEREAALQQQYRQLCQQRDDAREALTAARAASDSGLVAA